MSEIPNSYKQIEDQKASDPDREPSVLVRRSDDTISVGSYEGPAKDGSGHVVRVERTPYHDSTKTVPKDLLSDRHQEGLASELAGSRDMGRVASGIIDSVPGFDPIDPSTMPNRKVVPIPEDEVTYQMLDKRFPKGIPADYYNGGGDESN